MKRMFIIYDERAMYDVDKASVYVTSTGESLKEARRDAQGFQPCVIYSYAVGEGNILKDEKFEEFLA